MSYVRTLTICFLLVYFVSAAGCHCFDYYSKTIEQNKGHLRKTWKVLKQALNKDVTVTKIDQINPEGNTISEEQTGGETDDLGNYRPISVLSTVLVFSKKYCIISCMIIETTNGASGVSIPLPWL